MTVMGLLLTIKHTIFSDSRNIHKVVKERENFAVTAPPEETKEYTKLLKKAEKSIFDEYVGFTLTILGTFIWGYGDLLGSI